MFQYLKNRGMIIPKPYLAFDESPGGGGKEGGDNKDEGKVDKAAYDKLSSEFEDLRLEVMSPEYLEFLDAKEKGGGKVDPKSEDSAKKVDLAEGLSDDQIEKMSKKELMNMLTGKMTAAIKEAKDDAINQFTRNSKADTEREVAAFARKHEDYNTYRPIMYGISLDPKNKNLTLQELYEKAKEHVKTLPRDDDETTKVRKKSMAGEKPGGSSESFEELRKLDADSATRKAVAEVEEQLGPLPSA